MGSALCVGLGDSSTGASTGWLGSSVTSAEGVGSAVGSTADSELSGVGDGVSDSLGADRASPGGGERSTCMVAPAKLTELDHAAWVTPETPIRSTRTPITAPSALLTDPVPPLDRAAELDGRLRGSRLGESDFTWVQDERVKLSDFAIECGIDVDADRDSNNLSTVIAGDAIGHSVTLQGED